MTSDTLADTLATTMHTHPAHWSAVALGAVCALRGENAQPPFDTAINYVGLEHLDSGNPRLERWESASSVVSAKARFQAGDVLYGKLRPYLDKAALAEFDGVCSTDILALKPMASLDSAFLSYLVHTRRFIEEAVRSTGGVNLPRTSWNALSVAVFPLPPLAEQRAIARILRAAQHAIAARRREVTLERERKAALMQRLFTHGVRGEPTKQTEIGEMPQSWQVVRLGEIADVAYGLTVNETRRKCLRTAPYLTVANVTRGALRLDEVKQIGMLDGDSERFRVHKGDVLLVEGNGNPKLLGSAAIWRDELPFALHQNHLIRARPNQDAICSSWLAEYINGDDGRAQLLGRSKTSSGLQSINSRVVSDLSIPLPSLSEQREIADILAACDTHIAALEREISLHEELFRALLEELMSGRISALPLVEEIDIEASAPAS
jgi:type I restriction enzyme S subunit